MTNKDRIVRYAEDVVTDDSGNALTPADDDYALFKYELENSTNPLSDDYCKYDNE